MPPFSQAHLAPWLPGVRGTYARLRTRARLARGTRRPLWSASAHCEWRRNLKPGGGILRMTTLHAVPAMTMGEVFFGTTVGDEAVVLRLLHGKDTDLAQARKIAPHIPACNVPCGLSGAAQGADAITTPLGPHGSRTCSCTCGTGIGWKACTQAVQSCAAQRSTIAWPPPRFTQHTAQAPRGAGDNTDPWRVAHHLLPGPAAVGVRGSAVRGPAGAPRAA